MKVLFVCTSNKDRSPALEYYFRENKPEHEYKSAGINSFFTKIKKTKFLTKDVVDWADLIIFAENVHYKVADMRFNIADKKTFILNCGDYHLGEMRDYIHCAEKKLKDLL